MLTRPPRAGLVEGVAATTVGRGTAALLVGTVEILDKASTGGPAHSVRTRDGVRDLIQAYREWPLALLASLGLEPGRAVNGREMAGSGSSMYRWLSSGRREPQRRARIQGHALLESPQAVYRQGLERLDIQAQTIAVGVGQAADSLA